MKTKFKFDWMNFIQFYPEVTVENREILKSFAERLLNSEFSEYWDGYDQGFNDAERKEGDSSID